MQAYTDTLSLVMWIGLENAVCSGESIVCSTCLINHDTVSQLLDE